MQIGPMAGPAVQEFPHEKLAAKQAEARAVVAASLQASLNPEIKKSADIRATTQDLEHISLAFNRKLKFVIDHESNEVLVKVIDSETDKVIKVLPPEELQRLHQRIRETIGFLFDQRV
jgi:flagellar protein FlaG